MKILTTHYLMKTVILAFLLSGCVSVSKKMNSAPDALIDSQKSPSDISFCLANRFAGWASVDQARPDGSRIFLLKNAATNGLGFAVTLWPSGEGTHIEFRKGQYGLKFAEKCF